jgi:hypothetical protein
MLTTADFTGYFAISQDPGVAEKLTAYIEKYEKQYLVELFGYDLYVLFLAAYGAGPAPAAGRFLTVFNALKNPESSTGSLTDHTPFYPIGGMGRGLCDMNRDDRVTEPMYSEGILKMLKGFIYFEFLKDHGIEVAQTGITLNKNENSEQAGVKGLGMTEQRYNDAVSSFKVIRNYMIANPATYPEYDGIEKETTHWGGAF